MFISTYPGTRLELKSFSLYPADKLFSGSADYKARDLVLSVNTFWCTVAKENQCSEEIFLLWDSVPSWAAANAH